MPATMAAPTKLHGSHPRPALSLRSCLSSGAATDATLVRQSGQRARNCGGGNRSGAGRSPPHTPVTDHSAIWPQESRALYRRPGSSLLVVNQHSSTSRSDRRVPAWASSRHPHNWPSANRKPMDHSTPRVSATASIDPASTPRRPHRPLVRLRRRRPRRDPRSPPRARRPVATTRKTDLRGSPHMSV